MILNLLYSGAIIDDHGAMVSDHDLSKATLIQLRLSYISTIYNNINACDYSVIIYWL